MADHSDLFVVVIIPSGAIDLVIRTRKHFTSFPIMHSCPSSLSPHLDSLWECDICLRVKSYMSDNMFDAVSQNTFVSEASVCL